MHGSAPWKTEETIVGLPRLLVLSLFSRSDSPDLVAVTFTSVSGKSIGATHVSRVQELGWPLSLHGPPARAAGTPRPRREQTQRPRRMASQRSPSRGSRAARTNRRGRYSSATASEGQRRGASPLGRGAWRRSTAITSTRAASGNSPQSASARAKARPSARGPPWRGGRVAAAKAAKSGPKRSPSAPAREGHARATPRARFRARASAVARMRAGSNPSGGAARLARARTRVASRTASRSRASGGGDMGGLPPGGAACHGRRDGVQLGDDLGVRGEAVVALQEHSGHGDTRRELFQQPEHLGRDRVRVRVVVEPPALHAPRDVHVRQPL